MAKFVFPHALGKAAATYVRFFMATPLVQDQHMLGKPAFGIAPSWTQFAAQSISFREAHCHHSRCRKTRSHAPPGSEQYISAGVARPFHVRLSDHKRGTQRVQAANEIAIS